MLRTGGESADTLIGTSEDDTLIGAGGDDSLVGGVGGDLLQGDAGNDTLRGERGFDTLVGGAGDDIYLIDDLDDLWIENPGEGYDRLLISVNGAKIADRTGIESIEYIDGALPLAYWVDALAYGISWDLMGEPVTVRYAFLTTSTEPGFARFTFDDEAATQEVLQIWAAPTQLRWEQVDPDQADIVFGSAELSSRGADGITDFGGSGPTAVLIDRGGLGRMLLSDYWFDVLLHEVGHALWLKHPGDYNGSDGVGTPPFLGNIEDHDGNTVMSYNQVPAGVEPFTRQLRPFDVAAAQYLYGVNPTLQAGDTRWRVEQLAWPNNLVADGAGSDTLDASAVQPQAGVAVTTWLDLRPGALNAINTQPTGLISAAGHFSIGYHTVIEHALGSRGDDRINGNERDNHLQGGDGADHLTGWLGRDTLEGGGGDDRLVDDVRAANLLDGGDGDDSISLSGVVFGVAGSGVQASVRGGAGVDTLRLDLTPESLDAATRAELMALATSLPAGGVFARLGVDVAGVEQVRLMGSAGQDLNAPPLLGELTLTLTEDTALAAQLPIAIDLEGLALTYILPASTLHGTVQSQPSGGERAFIFEPAANFAGVDTLTYVVMDAAGTVSTGVVRLEVLAVDDAPVLAQPVLDRSATVGVPFTLTLDAGTFTDVDSPELRYSASLASGATLPSWLTFDAVTRRFSGTPGANDTGVLQVRLSANADSVGASEVFLLGVHATPNALPTAAGGVAIAEEDAVLQERLPLASDADGDALSYELAQRPSHGVVTVETDGRYRYAPSADFSGADAFDFIVSDGRGGAVRLTQQLDVRAVSDPAQGSVQLSGPARVGGVLAASVAVTDSDGLPATFTFVWLRDGVEVARELAVARGEYRIVQADLGARLSVRLEYVDTQGFSNTVLAVADQVVTQREVQSGSGQADALASSGNAPVELSGLGGPDTLIGSTGADVLDGGDGDDRLVSQGGADTVRGGAGFDLLVLPAGLSGSPGSAGSAGSAGARVDLSAGTAQLDGQAMQLDGIEAVVATARDDLLIGRDASGQGLDNVFVLISGNDTVDGRGGVDAVHLPHARQAVQITREGDAIRIDHPATGTALETLSLSGIERIRLQDVYLAFGSRAEEVVRVAFALWSPAIAPDRYLFARGMSFYDVGYGYDTLIQVANTFFNDLDANAYAQRLAGHVAGRSASELLALMEANGGSGPGQAGRDHVARLLADDPANLRQVELSGLVQNGVACDLVADGNLLFASLGP